ncbi:MAG TPA: sigma-70 family RNA polymerase sigma factor [Actinopolymorphaceae bacterium]
MTAPMNESDWLARRFEENRAHLRAVAYRMLGSINEAEDAVQESWFRLSRADTAGVENLGGWLTTVVARVCLDMLRSRKSRREESLDTGLPERASDSRVDPEEQALQADAVGLALTVVLDTLPPAERVAFVLHDMFAIPFDEIAPIVGRTPAAARQLASRARRRVQGSRSTGDDPARRRRLVEAFLAASRSGDFEALLEVLDPDVVLHADTAAVETARAALAQGAPDLSPRIHGAASVAGAFAGRARAARPALVDGVVGAAFAPAGEARGVFRFTVTDDVITHIEIIYEPEELERLHVELLHP